MQSTKNILLAAVIATLAASPALAGNGHGQDKHGGGKHAERHAVQKHSGKHASGKTALRHDDRTVHRRDDRHAHVDTRVLGAGGCPPGLAKKDNGCLPPGQAKKLIVGHAIPPGAVYVIPSNVMATLPPAPVGYRYAIVHNQVVLVSRGDIVVDIVRSLIG